MLYATAILHTANRYSPRQQPAAEYAGSSGDARVCLRRNIRSGWLPSLAQVDETSSAVACTSMPGTRPQLSPSSSSTSPYRCHSPFLVYFISRYSIKIVVHTPHTTHINTTQHTTTITNTTNTILQLDYPTLTCPPQQRAATRSPPGHLGTSASLPACASHCATDKRLLPT
jgi:hypothetical protein